MSIAELAKAIGEFGNVRTDNGLDVTVECLDVKQSYGKVRYLVTPCAGSGQAWVESVDWMAAPKEG